MTAESAQNGAAGTTTCSARTSRRWYFDSNLLIEQRRMAHTSRHLLTAAAADVARLTGERDEERGQ